MILTIPTRVSTFVGLFSSSLDKRKITLIPLLVSCLLLCREPKSFSALARTIITKERNRASISKFFGRKRFQSRNVYEDAMYSVIEQYGAQERINTPVVWFIIIDGVCSKRGGFSKIENAIKYKKKRKDKGPTTKSHTFLQGIIITHTGLRIPLPRRTYYTRSYCRNHHRKYLKMTRLAALIVETVKVPPPVRVVVLADEFFEGQALDSSCAMRGFTYITPVDSRRCMDRKSCERASRNLYKHGKSLDRSSLKKIALKPFKERTALLRRRTGWDKKQRQYFAAMEKLCVSGLGERVVVFSWKPTNTQRRWKSSWFKVLVSNATDLTLAQLIEYYELRWQIEIFFRELKSFMGLVDYSGQDFAAYERFFDMVLLAYLFLEWYRLVRVAECTCAKDRPATHQARTRTPLHMFQLEADRESIEYISLCGNDRGVLRALLVSVKRAIDRKRSRCDIASVK